ncbi:TauD/TfdA dioxygenase family protein [Hyphomonas sp.]|uniref:TauD/TfdA dioxygenase family protein n=1 Tax=Hyphomonas sp. TaxID=87 RepID=UPI00300282FC
MTLEIIPSGQACGAEICGVDLTAPLDAETIADIRAAWLDHQVLSFPDQEMSDADLERFTLYFGPFGDDPFIAPIPGHEHIIAVQRAADETAPIFAESWHTDWSFQPEPPSGTCLFGITIPPQGGDTLFANQYLALEQMPADLRGKLVGQKAIHSAKNAYAPGGMYGDSDEANGRSMTIIASPEAEAVHLHDIIRVHPETGRESIFGTAGYITGFDGMTPEDGWELLTELYRWQTRPEFQYRQSWQENMLVMWDNRCLLHMATGGYPGHDRLLHRTTIGAA